MKALVILSSMFFLSLGYAKYNLSDIIHNQQEVDPEGEQVPEQTSSSTEYISSEKIEQNMATSVDDVLRLTPGAQTSRGPRSSSEIPQVRGLDSRKISVTIDGAKQNYREGHSFITPVDVDNLKMVTVQKNNADFSETGSIGGGVEFTTKDPEDYIPKGKSNTSIFKIQHHSAANEKVVGAKTAFKNKASSGLISLSNNNANNLRMNNGSELSNSAYEDTNLMSKIKINDVKVKLEYFRRVDNSPLNASLDPPAELTRSLSDTITTKKAVNISYKNKSKLSLQAYVNDLKTEKQPRNQSDLQIRNIVTTGAKIRKDFKYLSAGVQTYIDRLNSERGDEGINSYPKAEGTQNSAYVSGKIPLGKTTILPGIRYDYYQLDADDPQFEKKSADAVSSKIEIKRDFTKKLSGKYTYSQGFNAPNVAEVFPTGLHNPGIPMLIRDNYFIPNTDLTHERSNMEEIELTFKSNLFSNDDEIRFIGSYYENEIENYITLERIDRSVFDFEDQRTGTTRSINIPRARIYGHELSVKYLYDIFETDLIYTQVRGRNLTEKLWLQDLPADFYTFNFVAYIDKYNMQLGYSVNHTLSQMRINPERSEQRTRKTPGYTIQNAFVKKSFKDFTLRYSVSNIGNKEYMRHASFLNESAEDHRFSIQYNVSTN